jgi:hypothetical protein
MKVIGDGFCKGGCGSMTTRIYGFCSWDCYDEADKDEQYMKLFNERYQKALEDKDNPEYGSVPT